MLYSKRIFRTFLIVTTLITSSICTAAENFKPFIVKDIQFMGLQRISEGTARTYLPIEVGDTYNPEQTQAIIKALFSHGLFDDIKVTRRNETILISVKERPVIQTLEFDGNKLIKAEDLLKGLKEMGLAPNEVLDRALLSRVELELQNQYHSHGLYGVKVTPEIKPLENNRVDILVKIQEGKAAKIQSINLVGNHSFKEEVLLKKFELKTGDLFSYFTKSDQYSKQKLAGDIETLRSHYLDRGFMDFIVDSTQVTLSPEKDAIFITITVDEGPRYVLQEYKIIGDLRGEDQEIQKQVSSYLTHNSLFSRQKVIDSAKSISDHLGSHGYAFANVNPVPEVDKESRTVNITFYVDPGHITYVRRIVFVGNHKTADEVLRREMRQSEGSRLSTSNVELSKSRLERLGYFKSVTVETNPVPDSTDQVDIEFTVEEQPSGSIRAGVGFAQRNGVLFNLGLSQKNFLGTGDKVNIAFNNSKTYRVFHVEHLDPYFTQDGISRSLKLSYRKMDAKKRKTNGFTKDVIAAGLGFGVPLSERSRFNFGFEYHDSSIKVNDQFSIQEQYFFDSEGKLINKRFNYEGLQIDMGYTYDSRNKAVFATEGGLYSINTMISTPGSDLEFFKVNLNGRKYFPLSKTHKTYKHWSFMIRGNVAYGSAYGSSKVLPFFEHFYAGGLKTVRGFDDHTIGPKQLIRTSPTGVSVEDPIGGDLRILAGMELFFPTPFVKDKTAFRTSFFMDAGNVIDTHNTGTGFNGAPDFDNLGDVRVSVGTAMTWLSQLGPLSISLGLPIMKEKHDEKQVIQFSFGADF